MTTTGDLPDRLRLDLSNIPAIPIDDSILDSQPDDDEISLRPYLSREHFAGAGGASTDLSQVTYLELLVNTTEFSLSTLGELLPNLSQLKLNGSTLATIRDLGTKLRSTLKVLWISRCSIPHLDGIEILEGLTEVYGSFNFVETLAPLSCLTHLEVLDLEGNSVSDLRQIHHLSECKSLHSLTLTNNPCWSDDHDLYVSTVREVLPRLLYLDDVLVGSDSLSPSTGLIEDEDDLEDHRKFLKELDILTGAIKATKWMQEQSAPDLLSSPTVVLKAPKFMAGDERDRYIRMCLNRPLSARLSRHRRQSRWEHLFVRGSQDQQAPSPAPASPVTARPNTRRTPNEFLGQMARRSGETADSRDDGKLLQVIMRHRASQELSSIQQEEELAKPYRLKKRRTFVDEGGEARPSAEPRGGLAPVRIRKPRPTTSPDGNSVSRGPMVSGKRRRRRHLNPVKSQSFQRRFSEDTDVAKSSQF